VQAKKPCSCEVEQSGTKGTKSACASSSSSSGTITKKGSENLGKKRTPTFRLGLGENLLTRVNQFD
jgi:hypothetical protein